jgi:hypothetical protein
MHKFTYLQVLQPVRDFGFFARIRRTCVGFSSITIIGTNFAGERGRCWGSEFRRSAMLVLHVQDRRKSWSKVQSCQTLDQDEKLKCRIGLSALGSKCQLGNKPASCFGQSTAENDNWGRTEGTRKGEYHTLEML